MGINRLILLMFFACNLWSQANAQRYAKGLSQQWETNLNKRLVELNELNAFIPKNAISPVYNTNFWNKRQAESAFFDQEPMIVIVVKSIEKAYPLSVLTYHQVINDKVANVPVALTYCPLSGSINVYDRRVRFEERTKLLEFGVSGMLRYGNTVLWDHSTQSWWQQADGKAIIGDMAGAELEIVPFMKLSYSQFYKNYPYGLVMDYHVDNAVNYGTNPYFEHDDPKKAIPNLYLAPPPLRLPPREQVLLISSMGDQIIYPIDIVKSFGVLNDTPNNNYVAVFYSEGVVSGQDKEYFKDSRDVGTCVVFSAFHDYRRLTFKKEGNTFVDEQTNSVWNITGKCISGPLKNDQLTILPYRTMFAYAALSMWQESRIFGESY